MLSQDKTWLMTVLSALAEQYRLCREGSRTSHGLEPAELGS